MQAKWTVSACDHIKSHPEFAVNVFKAAGIIKAIEQPETLINDTGSEEDNPFASASESDLEAMYACMLIFMTIIVTTSTCL